MTKVESRSMETFDISYNVANILLLLVNTLAALYAPIQDCDEVFNYWEPTHYLNRGFGFQTWEYSPEFALRSWLYILIHAVPGKIGILLFQNAPATFYLVRMTLAVVCTETQTCLFSTISKVIGPRIASIFLIAMISSTGFFYASVAYLPSSFSMYTSMMGFTAFLEPGKFTQGIVWFGVGAIIGWPFSAALIFPLVLHELLHTWSNGIWNIQSRRMAYGIARVLLLIVREPRSQRAKRIC